MQLSESSLHYLRNYFLLEQTRDETNQFLEAIAKGLARQVEVWLDTQLEGYLAFEGPWVVGNGGEAGVLLRVREGLEPLGDMARWKYYVQYNDAMRPCDLNDSTHCLVWGNTPKVNSAQIRMVTEMAGKLGLPDPYRVEEVPLLDASAEEVVERLAGIFGEYCDVYGRVVKALVNESRG